MGSLTRKQREYLRREEMILDAARGLMLANGYHGLTMDRIANAIEYSKATVYQHFRCKEEVIGTLAKRYLHERLTMQERARSFRGRSRERMTAVGEAVELFFRLHPDEVQFLQIFQAEAITAKASETVQADVKVLEVQAVNLVAGIVRDAVSEGDLRLDGGMSQEAVALGLMAVVIGGQQSILRRIPFLEVHVQDPFQTIMATCQVLGDGYGWKPLSTEWDYEETRRRVRAEIFPKESRLVYGG